MNDLEIAIPDPARKSSLATTVLVLDKLRSKELVGEIPPHIFFQLKDIFQILETLGSARIEGNNTTLSEYIEKVIENTSQNEQEQETEIQNLDRAISFIEENTFKETAIDRAFISHLHQMVTDGLVREGSITPGVLRDHNVNINGSKHTPPDYRKLGDYYENFLKFINMKHEPQNQLLMVAVAHHRFEYIHPFDNGNGRMGRLLTYALLIKLGFKVKKGRIINPSAVFYGDRTKYCDMLSKADSLTDPDVLAWSEYFLSGLKNEIEKIDSLLSSEYVRHKILLPSLALARERKHITQMEEKILHHLIMQEGMQIKSQELSHFGVKNSRKKSYIIKSLRDKSILRPITDGGRIYTINFVNNYLLRSVIQVLTKEGFVAEFLEGRS